MLGRRARAWTRKGIAEWLVERLAEDVPTLVGIRTVMSRDSFLAAFREVKAAMMAPSHFRLRHSAGRRSSRIFFLYE